MVIDLKLRSSLAGKKALPVRKIIVFALLGAFLIMAQVALSFIPNIELVSLLVIVYTHVLKSQVFYPVSVFILGEGLIYGFGLWWFNYLYIWAVLILVTLLLQKVQSTLIWAFVSALFGLFYGALCAIPYFFIGGTSAALAYWISGIPFDIIHCAGNFLAALILMQPTYRLIKQLSTVLDTGNDSI